MLGSPTLVGQNRGAVSRPPDGPASIPVGSLEGPREAVLCEQCGASTRDITGGVPRAIGGFKKSALAALALLSRAPLGGTSPGVQAPPGASGNILDPGCARVRSCALGHPRLGGTRGAPSVHHCAWVAGSLQGRWALFPAGGWGGRGLQLLKKEMVAPRPPSNHIWGSVVEFVLTHIKFSLWKTIKAELPFLGCAVCRPLTSCLRRR